MNVQNANAFHYTLNNGHKIPAFGLGTFWGKDLENVMKKAIDVGYRLIDTAFIYNNEEAIGRGLKAALQENKVTREELFIISKSHSPDAMLRTVNDKIFPPTECSSKNVIFSGNDGSVVFVTMPSIPTLEEIFKRCQDDSLSYILQLWTTRLRPKDVLPTINKSLKDLQLDYVDLYLIHWPSGQKPGENEYKVSQNTDDDSVRFDETWPVMEELVRLGLTKSIGVSNFNSQQIDRILKIATIKPVVNQVECNPYLSQEKLRKFCDERDILIMAYCPLYAPDLKYAEHHGLNLFEEPIIKALAQKYEKNAVQIIFKYLLQCGVVPIPKTEKMDRLKSNFDIWDFVLVPDDFEKMRSLNRNLRCITYPIAAKARDYPFNIEF